MNPTRYFLISVIIFSFIRVGKTQTQQISLQQGFVGSQYYANGVRLKPSEVRELLADFPEQRAEYTKGNRQRNTGAILTWTGLIGSYASLYAFGNYNDGWDGFSGTQKGLYVGSIASFITGLVLWQPGDKKVIWSYKDYMFQQRLLNYAQSDGETLYALIDNSLHNFERKKLSIKEHRSVLNSSPLALEQFNSSVKLNTIGLVTAGVSLGGFITLAATSGSRDDWSDFSTGTKIGLIGSFVGLLAGPIMGLVAQKKREKAMFSFYEDCNCLVQVKQTPTTEFHDKRSWSLGPTSNGIGLAYNF